MQLYLNIFIGEKTGSLHWDSCPQWSWCYIIIKLKYLQSHAGCINLFLHDNQICTIHKAIYIIKYAICMILQGRVFFYSCALESGNSCLVTSTVPTRYLFHWLYTFFFIDFKPCARTKHNIQYKQDSDL